MLRLMFAGCLLGIVACGDTITWLSLPVEDAASAILLVERAEETELIAQDLSSDARLLQDVAGIRRVDGVFPQQNLQELGLDEGRLLPLEDGVPLPESPAFVLFTNDSGALAWHPIERPPELKVPLLNHPDPCVRFVRQWIRTMDAFDNANFLVRLGPESLLVSAYSGEVFHLRGTDLRRLRTEPDLPVTAAAVSDAGTLWMGGMEGQIWRAELDLEGGQPSARLTTSTATPIRARVLTLIAERGVPGSVIMIDVSGVVARWDGRKWSTLHDFARPLFAASRLVYDDDGLLWVATDESQDVLRIDGDRVSFDSPEGLINGVPALEFLPDFGMTAISSGGDVFHRPDDTWILLEGSPISLNTYAIQRFSTGLVYGGVNGTMGQYRRPADYCPEQSVAQDSIRHIVPYQGALLLISDGPNGEAPGLELVQTAP